MLTDEDRMDWAERDQFNVGWWREWGLVIVSLVVIWGLTAVSLWMLTR